MNLAKSVSQLKKISSDIASGNIRVSEPWQGADVEIRNNLPKVLTDSFYPAPRFVITEHVGQLSWLFENLRDAFNNLEGYGFWKEEFFGRLGNAATRYLSRQPNAKVEKILLAVMHEAFCIAEEMEGGNFTVLPVTIGNEIYDDLFKEIEAEGLADQSEVDNFIKSLGIEA